MISCALLCDAAIGNVQEKAMKSFKASNAEVVLYSYCIGFVYLFAIMLLSGNLVSSVSQCSKVCSKCFSFELKCVIYNYGIVSDAMYIQFLFSPIVSYIHLWILPTLCTHWLLGNTSGAYTRKNKWCIGSSHCYNLSQGCLYCDIIHFFCKAFHISVSIYHPFFSCMCYC